ncbi:hypothetical protein VL10_14845 [Leclercia adecarboxylata]|nr:hypothetical protein VL10_14845 [Leclercia adecarboxylata]KMN63709.1 hypothetical protein VK95_18620 [Leclercia sp. LK8]
MIMQAKCGFLHTGALCFFGYFDQSGAGSGCEDHRDFFASLHTFQGKRPAIRNSGEQLKVVMQTQHGFQLAGALALFSDLRQFLAICTGKRDADGFRTYRLLSRYCVLTHSYSQIFEMSGQSFT